MKPVYVDGIRYKSIVEMCKKLGVNRHSLDNLIYYQHISLQEAVNKLRLHPNRGVSKVTPRCYGKPITVLSKYYPSIHIYCKLHSLPYATICKRINLGIPVEVACCSIISQRDIIQQDEIYFKYDNEIYVSLDAFCFDHNLCNWRVAKIIHNCNISDGDKEYLLDTYSEYFMLDT